MVLMFAGNSRTRPAGWASRCESSSPNCVSCTPRTRPTSRPPRPPRSRWGGSDHHPCGSGSRPNQHRRVTVKRDQFPQVGPSAGLTLDRAQVCSRRGAFVIAGAVVEGMRVTRTAIYRRVAVSLIGGWQCLRTAKHPERAARRSPGDRSGRCHRGELGVMLALAVGGAG